MFSRPTLAKDTEEGKEDACNNCDRVRGPRLPSRRAETQLLKSVRTRAAAREEGEGKGDRKEEARAKGERGRRKRGQRERERERGEPDICASECMGYKTQWNN